MNEEAIPFKVFASEGDLKVGWHQRILHGLRLN